jgi:hypothetical protein
MTTTCTCCGLTVYVVTKTDLGPMHFDCWDRWHSSPSESYAEHHAQRHEFRADADHAVTP